MWFLGLVVAYKILYPDDDALISLRTSYCYVYWVWIIFCLLFVISADEAVMISVACLIVLFSVQKYGTSKVGLAVGPALFIWFCTLAGIGIYNLVIYDSSVLKAFNPVHIYYFFKRNSTNAWYCLGGCLLCATGKHTDLLIFLFCCSLNKRRISLIQWKGRMKITTLRIFKPPHPRLPKETEGTETHWWMK